METYKAIFTGRLDFANTRSFEQVVKLYEHRMENYYKTAILFLPEDIFNEEKLCLDIPRHIEMVTKRRWNNTVNILKSVAEFAIAGDVRAWMLHERVMLDQYHIEPESDKTAVKAFLKGKKLMLNDESMEEAYEALTKAISKFETHALAYERRGFVNIKLENYEDAIYDYNKSIKYNERTPHPYYGRGLAYEKMKDDKAAIIDFDNAIKRAMPLQTIYWQACRMKANSLIKVKDFENAVVALDRFSKRNFTPDNQNFLWRKKVFALLGKSLMEVGRNKEAVVAFASAGEIEKGHGRVSNTDLLVNSGIARKAAGMKGFRKEWQVAADQGSKRAAKLLLPASKKKKKTK